MVMRGFISRTDGTRLDKSGFQNTEMYGDKNYLRCVKHACFINNNIGDFKVPKAVTETAF